MNSKTKVLTFLHFPKNAGTSIIYILRRSFPLGHVDVDPMDGHKAAIRAKDLELARRIYGKRLKSMAGHGLRMDTDFAAAGIEPDLFLLLRNPVSRCISWYQYRIQRRNREKRDPHEAFSRKGASNFQTRRIAGEDNLQKAIDLIEERVRFVGLVERFDESLIGMREEFSEYDLKIDYRRQNSARDNTLKEEIKANESLMELLHEKNQLDLDLCAYVEKRFFSSPEEQDEGQPGPKDPGLSSGVVANRMFRNLVYKSAVKKAKQKET